VEHGSLVCVDEDFAVAVGVESVGGGSTHVFYGLFDEPVDVEVGLVGA